MRTRTQLFVNKQTGRARVSPAALPAAIYTAGASWLVALPLRPSSLSLQILSPDSTLHRTMAAKYFLVLGCLALSQGALVKRDAPNLLQDMQTHAAEFQKTFSEQFAALVNSKNSQDVQKSLKEGSDSLLTQFNSLSSSLQSAMTDASGKAKEALESSQANLKKTADELRAAHPEIETQATALKDKISAAMQNALQEAQKLAKELAANAEETNQKLAPQVKQAYDDFVKHAQDIQKNVHDAANKQ